MTASKWTIAAMAAAFALGGAGAAQAASTTSHHNTPHHMTSHHMTSHHRYHQAGRTGNFYIAAGDNRAAIERAYPNDANPPSLRQSYNLRWRKMQEQRR
jgi:hypothetical protein